MFQGRILCLFVVILSVHDIHTTINTVEKNIGDDVVLKCELSGTYPSWQQDKSILTYVGDATFRDEVDEWRLSYDENNRDLCIKELNTSDSGKYRCMMSNSDEYTIQLTVTCCRKTFDRFVGEHVTFNCPLTGENTEWYGPENKLPLGHHRKLHIRNLKHSDAGVYKCKVPSVGTHSFNLNIHNINTFATLTEYAGGEVTLECKLSQITLPYWYSPEFSVVPLMHAGNSRMNPHTTLVKEGRLSIHNERDLHVRNLKTIDAGQYKCFMFRVGTHTINLTVLERQLENTQKRNTDQLETRQATNTGSSVERTHVTKMSFVATAMYMLMTALFCAKSVYI